MATDSRNRINITTVDDETFTLLNRVSDLTGLSPAQIIMKLMLAHTHELYEYANWLEGLVSPEAAQLRSMGKNLLFSYGPEDLIDSIAQIDPSYVKPAVRKNTGALTAEETTDLRRMLGEWRAKK